MPDPNPYHFHETAEDIRLEGWTLWAKLKREDGSWNVAQLRLNYVLGNDDGEFTWDGARAGDSAEGDPSLVYWQGYPIVRASLRGEDGKFQQADYNLSDTVGNDDGDFYFQFKGNDMRTTSDPDKFECGIGYVWVDKGEIDVDPL
ncbi:hypothetical protein N7454_010741 [Penicillium verhagenii]|nr:hypothetical protein N7454_010741 [Penicillium verhagenii]